ncbi:DUF2171 domain-containing protein [Sphingomonas sp. DT-204]|uniref:DUF2171 domain-containing protein n=1 Tax=Sphingomonas sp. DT-204 TaxID=3396166 RepID=UPI003F1CAF3D
MVDDRFRNDDFTRGYNRREDQDYGRDYGSGRDYSYSSARNYEAAGMIGDDRNFRSGGTGYGGGYSAPYERPSNYGGRESYGRDYGGRDYYGGRDVGGGWDLGYRGQGYGQQSFGGDYRGSYAHDGRRFAETGRGYERDDRGSRGDRDDWRRRGYRDSPEGYNYDDRGFMARAGDEIRSWFGDEDAERRRELDQRYDERMGYGMRGQNWGSYGHPDRDYHSWRRSQIDALDRDYDEYRRENARRFESEFGTWRSRRQTQRSALQRVEEHMEVVGSDGEHVGTVDRVRGDRIILTKSDADAGGRHHSIPSSWIQSVDDKVTIIKSAEEAKTQWRDEERSSAFFGSERERDRDSDEGKTDLNRSFSGTY